MDISTADTISHNLLRTPWNRKWVHLSALWNVVFKTEAWRDWGIWKWQHLYATLLEFLKILFRTSTEAFKIGGVLRKLKNIRITCRLCETNLVKWYHRNRCDFACQYLMHSHLKSLQFVQILHFLILRKIRKSSPENNKSYSLFSLQYYVLKAVTNILDYLLRPSKVTRIAWCSLTHVSVWLNAKLSCNMPSRHWKKVEV
jgi:hypothetical protein